MLAGGRGMRGEKRERGLVEEESEEARGLPGLCSVGSDPGPYGPLEFVFFEEVAEFSSDGQGQAQETVDTGVQEGEPQ